MSPSSAEVRCQLRQLESQHAQQKRELYLAITEERQVSEELTRLRSNIVTTPHLSDTSANRQRETSLVSRLATIADIQRECKVRIDRLEVSITLTEYRLQQAERGERR